MTVDEIAAHLREALDSRAVELGLMPGRITVAYQLNWGGFVNASFRASDGRRAYHIKLANEPELKASLARWLELHSLLTARYHAPAVHGWIDVDATGHSGLIFESIDGRVPAARDSALVRDVLPVLHGLHGNEELASVLRPAGVTLCRATFVETYAERFSSDLDLIARMAPAFVPAATQHWLRDETRRLARLVDESQAFDEPTHSPIHADLWLNNFLVTGNGRWYILDWDELRVGDSALDLAIFFGPTASDLSADRWREWVPALRADPALLTRLELYARAALLDWVIDPVADYLDADVAPEHAASVRAEKQRIHVAALDRYRKRYASDSHP